ncbi:UDP-glucose 4-epimerase [Colletotrichum tofieldiae]|uniref:UDP-glucose 4-epimerase uge1 n=1 Tax=Colletotrichum liriopes TaxID=708192 RepID=A0AA37GDB9_9PEZI|nr:UDP-glucose 4-epimerase uge1 [Colletotrichum liriopes]GKT61706.1 UDP-glucose 4-epimerase [Colletotrichum tofieldiae]GKT70240.1 UDP-glucose 4-epimerase [Colletotrichum tofieldiae]
MAVGTVLVTGGTGYIGSFTSLTLLENGYDVVIVDSLYNSSKVAVDRIELLSGKRPHFYQVDITDKAGLDEVFKKHPEIDSVIHFAALKAFVEQIITDHIQAERNKLKKASKPFEHFNGALLRYFNPCGAHPSGLMGEDPQGVPYNLLPLLGKVATGDREKLLVFGDDYSSRDGTAIRDYIHVVDLAKGHLAALNYLRENKPGVKAWNLGSGRGSTVFEMIKAFSHVVGRDLPYEVVPRRQGDVLDLTANPSLANKELSWKTEKTLEEACEDLWRWVNNNPKGYRQDPPPELLANVKPTSG